MNKFKKTNHSVLRCGISKILVSSTLILISINAFADMSDCVNATKAENWQEAIRYCKPLIQENDDALALLANAYSQSENGMQAQKYFQIYIDKNKNNPTNPKAYSNYVSSLGNYYYFGEDGAKKDIKKGLKYITKGAQLGNFYNSNDGELPKLNTAVSYKWFEIASINGSQKAKSNVFLRNINVLKEQVPYCIAMGQQLVAESYINGEAGLPKSDNQAKNYLIQAIELYKESKQPSEDELKYCPPQKGLDLASAEKLLEKIK
ncbi:sel1 repeat family protein [Francisella philomiragia]|uniref:Sel1 repeat family protein n=1 Tax=Francisella philomiragia TaxID=28110 RepID=A0ABS1G9S2_9GAMM|nr:sel1 repeat family protein [Francisella philomiragia]MBK2257863.1 sel1 repeat family protein [Francisella philomiragia]MBK2301551.1 sel1 repeat family protein [Francisella philomiragia]